MTGGLKSLVAALPSKGKGCCATCGASLQDKQSSALTCSDRCRKIKNGQTHG